MSIEIPKNKWIEVYNSISLFWFAVDSNNNRPEEISQINQAYNAFCIENSIPGEGYNITAPENMMLFGYALIVRAKEIIDPVIKDKNVDGKSAREYLYQSIFDEAGARNVEWFSSYSSIIENQQIDIQTCTFSDKAEYEKLYQFVRHLRHSIAHSTYELIDGGNTIGFESKNRGVVNLKATMPIHGYINFVLYFSILLNSVIHTKNLLV